MKQEIDFGFNVDIIDVSKTFYGRGLVNVEVYSISNEGNRHLAKYTLLEGDKLRLVKNSIPEKIISGEGAIKKRSNLIPIVGGVAVVIFAVLVIFSLAT